MTHDDSGILDVQGKYNTNILQILIIFSQSFAIISYLLVFFVKRI